MLRNACCLRGGILTLATGCGPKDVDMSGLSFADKEVIYDGTAQSINLVGELPEGIETSDISYFSDEEYATQVTAPTNVGKYYAKATFTVGKKFNAVMDMKATLTILPADFLDASVVIGGTYLDGETSKTVEAKTAADGTLYFEYNEGVAYKLSVLSTLVDGATGLTPSVKYYKELNADGTVKEDSLVLTNNTIRNAGDSLHLLITFRDENHNAKTILKSVTVVKKEIKISTYEELQQMRTDARTIAQEVRANYVYSLQNDINCEGAVWKTIGGTFGGAQNDTPFSSEFNGNGHTISNFKLTNQSVDHINDTNGPHIGFFGYIISSYIHDVNFDGVEATISTEGYDWSGINPVYFGFVVARMEADGSNGNATNLENIKITNSHVNVEAYKAIIGGVIGLDQVRAVEGVKRNNLTVENTNIFAKPSSVAGQRVAVGGLVGENNGEDVDLVFNNCLVKNVKIGYDHETYTQTNDTSYLPQDNNFYAGGFIGRAVGTAVTFNVCHLKNFFIAGKLDNLHGFFGNATFTWGQTESGDVDWDNPVYITNFNNCTHSIDAEYEAENIVGFAWAWLHERDFVNSLAANAPKGNAGWVVETTDAK